MVFFSCFVCNDDLFTIVGEFQDIIWSPTQLLVKSIESIDVFPELVGVCHSQNTPGMI